MIILKSDAMIIEKEILDKTVQCPNHFGCIINNDHVCCKVERCVGKEVYFVQSKQSNQIANCNYKLDFGHSAVCTCPSRKEIYNKYGL